MTGAAKGCIHDNYQDSSLCAYCGGVCDYGFCRYSSGWGPLCPDYVCHSSPGQYCVGTELITTPCPIGSYCPFNDMTVPTPCSAGSYCPVSGLSAPRICPAGSFCPVQGLLAPLPCPGGYICPTSGFSAAPLICPVGFVCVSGSSAPIPCPLYSIHSMQVCNTTGLAVLCNNGTYMTSQFNSVDCPPCPAGSKCVPDGPPPVLCPAGTYSPYGATQCTPCGNGTYSSSAGSPVCTMCPLGYTTSPMGATSSAQCSCSPGFYSV
jgi:hypothetical protein